MSERTLAELQEERDKRDAARRATNEARSKLLLELELKYEDELGGPKGVAFAIVNVPESPIVVKLGAAVMFKRFVTAKKDKDGNPSYEDTVSFIVPNVVYPERPQLEDIIDKRAAVATAVANKLIALYQGDEEGAAGKL